MMIKVNRKWITIIKWFNELMELYEITKPDLKKKALDSIIESKAFRVKYFEDNFYSFAIYYFTHFFSYKSSRFHKEWAKSMQNKDKLFILWFRESWKTIWLMIYLIWVIVYKKKNYILYYSYEQSLSSSRLFDIIIQLKTNSKLISDYGNMFPNIKSKDNWLEKKSVQEFITTNKIKLKAMSMGKTSRWLLYSNNDWAFRPDLLLLDDIDVIESVRNPAVVDKNYAFLKWEIFGWLDAFCQIIFLGNVISSDWIVPRHRRDLNDKWYHSEISVLDKWNITWDRFVKTDQEQAEWLLKWVKKISLEEKEREQKENFKPNFLLIPMMELWSPVFDPNKINKFKLLIWEEDKKYRWLKIYKEPEEDIFWWVDTALWWTWDYSVISIRNRNKELLVSYKQKVAPDYLAEVIDHLVNMWYKGKILIENNNTWLATITKAKEYDWIDLLYWELSVDKVTNQKVTKLWFNTNSKTKPLIISQLNEYINDDLFIEIDERWLNDYFNYYYDEKWATNALLWHHDDIIIADAICLHWIITNPPVIVESVIWLEIDDFF